MSGLRHRWVQWLVLWTVLSVVVAVLIAFQAVASLYHDQQVCFLEFPAIPCPGADDPRFAQLTFAFFGVPLIWLVGVGVTVLGLAVQRRRDGRRDRRR